MSGSLSRQEGQNTLRIASTPSGAVNVSLQWQQIADPRNGFVFKAW
jgi:hypothetical protein